MAKLSARDITICVSVMLLSGMLRAGEPAVDETLKALEAAAVPGDVSNPQQLRELAYVHMNHGALERAEKLMKRALELAQDERSKRYMQSGYVELLTRKKDYPAAIAVYESQLKGLPAGAERLRTMLSLSDLQSKAGNAEAAENLLNDVAGSVQNASRQSEEHWIRRDAQQRLVRLWRNKPGRLDLAIKETGELVVKDPKNETALERLCELYTAAGTKAPELAQVLERLAELRPEDDDLLSRLGGTYQSTAQFDKAAEIYRKLLARPSARNSSYHSTLFVQCLFRSGQKEQAVTFLKDNLLKQPVVASHEVYSLVNCCELVGLQAEAEALLVKAAANAREAQEKSSLMLFLADLYQRQAQFAKAEAQYKAILEAYKDTPAIADSARRCLESLARRRVEQPLPRKDKPEAVPPPQPPKGEF